MNGLKRLATGAWLDRSLMRGVSWLMIAGTIGAIAVLVATRTGTLDAWGRPLGTDFSNVWTAGRMALEGRAASVYDLQAHYQVQQALHGSEAVPFYGWLYPPPFLLVAAALATLPYGVALVLFEVATLIPALLVIRRILPDRDAVLVALGGPAVLVCLTHGHNGFLTAGLFGAGLLLLERRQSLAGICFGLLAYKPQLGLLLPLALLAGGYGRAVLSAAVTVATLVIVTAAAFGPEVWTAFLGSLSQTRIVFLENGGPGWHTMQSAFATLRAWGAGVQAAYTGQAAVTLAVTAGTVWIWRRHSAFELRAASVMLAGLLATPYVMDYDLVLLGPVVAFLVVHGIRTGFVRWEVSALALAWLAPLVSRQLALLALVPAGLLVLVALFVIVASRALGEGRTLQTDGAAQPA